MSSIGFPMRHTICCASSKLVCTLDLRWFRLLVMTHLGESYNHPNDGYTDRPEPSQPVRMLTVPEAAEFLGITTDAVRSRMRRGKLRREEGEDGTVYVLLEGNVDDSPKTAKDGRETVDDRLLVEHMASEIDHLRDQLEEAHAANRENRRIIATLTQRIPELEAPQETPGASEELDGVGIRPKEARRSWLYRFFVGTLVG